VLIEVGQLSQALQMLGLERYEAAIAGVARPALALEVEFALDTDFPIGASRFGGDPDLAPGMPWPTKTYNQSGIVFEQPLQFLLQLNLADLARYQAASSLPKTGLLSFFYDIYEQPWGSPEDRGAWRVVHQTGRRLERRDSPPPPEGEKYSVAVMRRFDPRIPAGHDDCHILPRRISFTEFLSLPEQELFGTAENVERFWDAERAGFDVENSDRTKLPALYALPFEPRYQLFGNPSTVQGAMDGEPERAWRVSQGPTEEVESNDRAGANRPAWNLLLQIDSLEESMWGDSGTIYFWIREDHLAASRFDESWLILQCC
jgi:uncharacterized protein YwqG